MSSATIIVTFKVINGKEVKLNEMIKDEDYCLENNIYSKSDMLRKELNAVIKDYEQYKFNKSITT